MRSMTPSEHLTRRRDPDRKDRWLIYCTDIHAGTIALAVGVPGAQRYTWHCGFYPGSEPGECRSGSASSFEEARVLFERAWQVFSANRTEADYAAYREQRDWTRRKYEARDRGDPVPLR